SAKPATARLGLGLLPNNPSTPGGQIYFGASADKGVSFQPALTPNGASSSTTERKRRTKK
ncbi:hypothetical protein QZM03_26535, partial [Burkholderia multivorans]|nr:hypothetical protein [Burkholderia multivorans]